MSKEDREQMKGGLLKEHQHFGGVEESLPPVVTNEK